MLIMDLKGQILPATMTVFEETAAEIAEPYRAADRSNDQDNDRSGGNVNEGRGIGYIALALSIISLFVLPVLLGAAGIIVGYIARRRGAQGLGAWAMGIGVVSLVLGIFIIPFSLQKLDGFPSSFCVSSLILLFQLQVLRSVPQQECQFLFEFFYHRFLWNLTDNFPFRNSSPSPRAPAIPISASLASPGPFTAQPRTATLIGAFILEIYSSTSLAMLIRSISIRPQVGHEMSVAALEAKPKDFRSSLATFTSSTGSALSEMRMVFPMPLLKMAPSPAALFTVPANSVPDSVIPR